MSPARGEGLRLLGGMLTVEPGTGKERRDVLLLYPTL